jgi:hypothetical protein
MDMPAPDNTPDGALQSTQAGHPGQSGQPATGGTRTDKRLSNRQATARALIRVVAGVAAITALYAAVPIDTDTSIGALAIMVLGALVFITITAHNLRTLRRSAHPVAHAIRFLALIAALFVTGFAATYLAIGEANPQAFSEPLNKVSALYFTVTVLATVGFGDITATTDGARAVVTVQMISGLILIAVLARYVMRVASQRAAFVHDTEAGSGDVPSPVTGPNTDVQVRE